MGYFLVARDMTSNDFKLLELKSSWYIKDGTEVLQRSNRLEAIDLVTTRFSSREEMAKRMVTNKYIDHEKYDFFIVSKYKKNNEEKLKFQEVIYNTKDSRINPFRKIAYNSLNNHIKCEENIRLLDKFMNKCYYSKEYNRIINERLTALPKRFIDVYGKIRNKETVPYNLKYKYLWSLEDYKISRSIIDSFNRFDDLNYNDVYRNHIYYFKDLTKERLKLYKQLLEVCDKNYIEGQMNIFEQPKKETISNNKMSITDKKNYVIRFFKNLDVSNYKKENGKYYIDIDKYLNDISKEEYSVLRKGINSRIINSAFLYSFHLKKIKAGDRSFGSFTVLQEDLSADLNDLNKSLKDDKIIERTYEYCKTLETVQNKSLSEGVKTYKKN